MIKGAWLEIQYGNASLFVALDEIDSFGLMTDGSQGVHLRSGDTYAVPERTIEQLRRALVDLCPVG